MDVEKFLIDAINEIRTDLKALTIEVAVLKTKAAVLAAIAGGIAGLVPVLAQLIFKT